MFPSFKFCPNCGKKNITVDEQLLVCSDCELHLYHNTAAAVCVIIEKGNEILLTKRVKDPAKGLWDLPGGFVDPDESAEDCVRREIQEELQIKLKDISYVISHPNTYIYKGITYKTCDMCFTAKLADDNPFELEKEEISEAKWFSKQDVDLSQVGLESIQYILKEYIQNQ